MNIRFKNYVDVTASEDANRTIVDGKNYTIYGIVIRNFLQLIMTKSFTMILNNIKFKYLSPV